MTNVYPRTYLRGLFAALLLLISAPLLCIVDTECIGSWPLQETGENGGVVLRRTYQPADHQRMTYARRALIHPGDPNDQVHRSKKPVPAGGVKMDTLAIEYEDFLYHLEPGRLRYSLIMADSLGILEDVGENQVLNGRWVVPDFDNYAYVNDVGILQLDPSDTDGYDEDFPDATHAFYNSEDSYQYFSLIEEDFELRYLGMVRSDGYIYDGEFTQSPVPLRQGLGEFGGEQSLLLCEESRGGCAAFPTADFIIPEQIVLELASGEMVTPEDGDVPAIKARSMEILTYYDYIEATDEIDSVGVDTIFKLVFYSLEGHHLTGTLADGYTYEDRNVVFSELYYQQLVDDILPVEWLNIQAELVKNAAVKVKWSTATEVENERFIVERSEDGERFAPIGGLDAVGNSTTQQDYTFTDEAPLNGFNYYRVQQQDFNGRDTYSSIVSALVTKTTADEELVLLYPNPGRDEVYFSRPAAYELMAIDGQVLASGQAEQQLDVSALPAGTYLVRIDGGEAYRWVKR